MAKTMMFHINLTVLIYLHLIKLTSAVPSNNSRLNVLLIMSDDLRPELGCYVRKSPELRHLNQQIKTPRIDALAGRSMMFTHAFSQYPLCNPSRTSLLTGRSPQVTRVMGNIQSYKTAANFTTLPGYFKSNGYTTLHTGKIFHDSAILDFEDQWHTNLEKKYNINLKKHPHGREQSLHLKRVWSVLEDLDEKGNDLYYDDLRVEQAINYMKQIKKDTQKKPFFMGVGFLKNHLPLEAPKRFFDMYPPEKIAPPPNYYKPENFPGQAAIGFCEMGRYEDAHADGIQAFSQKNAMSVNMTRDLRRAYYSTISWVDYNVGRLLDGLKQTGFDKNTVVILTADHGYHLGENNHFCKLKLLDLDLRVPLLIHVPGQTDNGMMSNEIVELLDLFPTLTELAGLPLPEKCSLYGDLNTHCVDGKSLKYLLDRTKKPPLTKDRYAFSVVTRNNHTVVGYSVRDHKFRYTEWLNLSPKTFCPNFEVVLGKELYSIVDDPQNNVNIFSKPESKEAVNKYSSLLKVAWGSDCFDNQDVPASQNRITNIPANQNTDGTISANQGAHRDFASNRNADRNKRQSGNNKARDNTMTYQMFSGRNTYWSNISLESASVIFGVLLCLIFIIFFSRFKRHFKVLSCKWLGRYM